MATLDRYAGRISAAAILCFSLVACGGGDSPAAVGTSPPVAAAPETPVIPTEPEDIEGVATPSSVAVVTATNATT